MEPVCANPMSTAMRFLYDLLLILQMSENIYPREIPRKMQTG